MKKNNFGIIFIMLSLLTISCNSGKTDKNSQNKEKKSTVDSLKIDRYLKELKKLPELDDHFKSHLDEIDKKKVFYINNVAYYKNFDSVVRIVNSEGYSKINKHLPIEFMAVFDYVQTSLWGPEFVEMYTIKKIIKPVGKFNFLENTAIIIEFDDKSTIVRSDHLLKKYKCTKNDFICKGQLSYKFDFFLDRGANHHYRGFYLNSDLRYKW
ncbi:MAG: hypothetical protein WCP69_07895 [Bacteroidota bacterium]